MVLKRKCISCPIQPLNVSPLTQKGAVSGSATISLLVNLCPVRVFVLEQSITCRNEPCSPHGIPTALGLVFVSENDLSSFGTNAIRCYYDIGGNLDCGLVLNKNYRVGMRGEKKSKKKQSCGDEWRKKIIHNHSPSLRARGRGRPRGRRRGGARAGGRGGGE